MNRIQVVVIVLLIIAFLPFCYAGMYALPFADDFCIGWELLQGKPLLTGIAEQYLYWNGRYTSDVLINLHPIKTGNLAVYSAVILLSLIATPVVFYILVQQVLKHRATSLIVGMVLSLVYLNYMPQLTEGIYWYGGIVNYHLGVITMLLQIRVFVRLFTVEKKPVALYMLSICLLVISIGFNEIGAVLIPLLYFVLLAFNYKQTANRKLFSIHFAVAAIASAFVMFSPGNATRLGEFNDKYNFFHSAFYASLQTLRFVGLWILSYPFITFSMLAVIYSDRLRDTIIGKMDWRIALASAFGIVFMAAFVPYFATGILGQHRTMNYVYPFFLLLWFVALVHFGSKYDIVHDALRKEAMKRFLVLSSIAVLFVTGNSLTIWSDIAADRFAAYKGAYLQRQETILADTRSIQPLKSIPATFELTDAKADSSYWINKCMRLYYEKTKVGLR